MWEDNRGISLRLRNTAVPDPLLPIIIFCREEKKKWLAPTPLQACTARVGVLGEAAWDEVTLRLLLYSFHSVGILFTPELLCFGPCWKCAVQTIDAASAFSRDDDPVLTSLSTNVTFMTFMILKISSVARALLIVVTVEVCI